MPRRTRQSEALTKAEERVKAMETNGIEIDLGNGVSRAAYMSRARALREKLNAYNALIAQLNELQQELTQDESELSDFSESILLGVAALYGKQSKQYEQSGGTRKTNGGWIDRN